MVFRMETAKILDRGTYNSLYLGYVKACNKIGDVVIRELRARAEWKEEVQRS